MRLYRPILFLLLFIHLSVYAQQNMTNRLFYRIAEKNGLSNNLVNAIVKDKEGFLWIATFDGLNRFDGTHFTVFRNDRNVASSLVNNSVHGLCVDSSGNIWCATESGISCLQKNSRQFTNYFPMPENNAVAYTDILCDKSGAIWCSSNCGIHEFQAASKTFKTYSTNGPPGRSLSANINAKRSMALSPDGKSIWLATIKGINQLDICTKEIFNYQHNPAGLKVFDSLMQYPLCFDRKENLIYGFATKNQLAQYNFKNNSVHLYDILYSSKTKNKSSAAYIYADKNNRLWVSTWGYACFIFNMPTGQVAEFSYNSENQFSIPGDFFWNCFEDEEKTLWLATLNGMASSNTDADNFKLYQPLGTSRQHGLLNSISAFTEDDKNAWWFTCYNKNELYKYIPSSGAKAAFKIPTGEYTVRAISQHKNYLVLTTNRGVICFNLIKDRFEMCPDIRPLQQLSSGKNISWLQIIGDSVACALMPDIGIVQYHLLHKTFKSLPAGENEFLKRNINRSRNCTVAPGGDVFISFNATKIGRYNLQKNKLDSLPFSLDKTLKLTDGTPMKINTDSNGNLWVALRETGLIFYNVKNGSTKLWQQPDGLVINQVYETINDHYGNNWSAAYNKFSVFDPVKNIFENFSIPVSENNYAYTTRMLPLRNGNVLSNIGKNFIEWIPERIFKNKTDLPVLINKIVVGDSVWMFRQNVPVRLHHTQNSFTIEFGVLTALDKSHYQLEYKLEGFEEKWNKAGPLNTATYTNVPEKNFVFRVRTVAASGNWVGKETIFSIQVKPPFYRTTLFIIVAAIFLACLIVFLIRWRISQVRKSETEKSEFNKRLNEWKLKALRSQMNPHFIFNCMNSIDMYILKNDAENASRYLNKFAKLVRLILRQSNDMYVPLGKELELLTYYLELEQLRLEYPFAYSIECSNDIDQEETEIPSMLLQPYVENAILHGLRHKKENGILKIQIKRDSENLYCLVEDNGIGRIRSAEINSARQGGHESRGTILADERLKVLENEKHKPVIAIIDLHDVEGNARGTKVEIKIPMDFDY